MIGRYPKILHLGDPKLEGIWDGDVVVQEKIDGSQISWAWIDGTLHVRSKGKTQWPAPDTDKMFMPGIEYLLNAPHGPGSVAGLTFRGELVNGLGHNTVKYERAPRNGLVLYDVELPNGDFSIPEVINEYADFLEIEAVRHLRAADYYSEPAVATYVRWSGLVLQRALENTESQLGGEFGVEGLVVKNYTRFHGPGPFEGMPLFGKFVREEFKEKHSKAWRQKNPTQGDLVQDILDAVNTPARFDKAVQYLRDHGQLEGTPRDIGPLMKYVATDILEEEGDWIREQLWNRLGPKIRRGLGRGLPQWYKEQLAFGGDDD